ncbi:hypothetical protein BOX15_Mlig028730g1 [Macrostomum lignano]|uniref:Uncharacterized protein n=2 Tax=Macrostomum lignano TaxID=282301 RepID=A0A267ERN7_9PLAT|nr:hypothetical protein BOX15_Mlig028730g3 [Macrostomum lignano]PAA66157.1 hypothetical protein BOX15_Mlig028730g2 [Macrostomum lignano]PAA72402.1 hypothetical protein BOX15_Mlig028730g1 [Macrostomum lignano]
MPPIELEKLIQDLVSVDGSLRIFGYGSLIWKPNFPFKSRTVGYIKGYERRFYQGTTTHRGTPEWPGRVATLIEAKPGTVEENPSNIAITSGCTSPLVWGVAYELRGLADIRSALAHLAEREMILGGYRFDCVQFYPYLGRRAKPEDVAAAAYSVQVYIAEPGNDQYLGSAPLDIQAYQIARAEGFCGRNIEYVKKVAVFMLEEVPNGQDKDRHVFELVRRAEAFLYEEDDLTEEQKALMPVRVLCPHGDHQLREANAKCTCQLADRRYSDEVLRDVIL